MNLGDVISEEGDIYGDGVNVAARLESIAEPGGIAISGSVRDHVGNRLDLTFEDRGEQQLKNIEKPVRVYDVCLEETKDASMALAKSDKPSIAVLPFNNMSGDPEQEYFSDGITEDIITDLSKISGLLVIARHTAFTYKNKPVKVQQVGQELGVGHILEGSVRKAGSRVRVTGQLINSQDGSHLWADRFDRELTDIFAIQDEITHAIVDQLKVTLLPQEKKSIGQARTDNVEAYTYYLKGRQLLQGGWTYYKAARKMFEKATELDPFYARAYAGIADCDSFLYLQTQESITIEDILATSARALALDNDLAEAHASCGLALSLAQRDEEAFAEFEKAVRLDRNNFEAHYFFARTAFKRGDRKRAVGLYEQAARIKPDDYQPLCLAIPVYLSMGNRIEAEDAARRGLARAERKLELHPESPRPAYLGAYAWLALGQPVRALEWAERALAIAPDDILTLYSVACVYAQLGQLEKAFDLLTRRLQDTGPEWARWLKLDWNLDPLRSHPRYHQLISMIRARHPDLV